MVFLTLNLAVEIVFNAAWLSLWYHVNQKRTAPLLFFWYLWFLLTDFQFFHHCSQKWLAHISEIKSPHCLNCVAALPDKNCAVNINIAYIFLPKTIIENLSNSHVVTMVIAYGAHRWPTFTWTYAWYLLHHYSIAILIMLRSGLHQNWISHCYNSSMLWLYVC